MTNWKRLMGVIFLWLGLFHSSDAVAQAEQTTKLPTKEWKSSNGKYALKVDETTTTSGVTTSRGFMRRTFSTTRAAGITVPPEGAASEQWQWTRSEFSVAAGLVADSGKAFVLVKVYKGFEATTFPPSANLAVPLVVVILDEKGMQHAAVTLDAWVKTLGPDGKISPDAPPVLRFLENEKVLEMKLASGRTVRVDTHSGQLSAEKPTATAPATTVAASVPE